MKAIVGVYETREAANNAIHELETHGFSDHQVTLINKDELLHNHIHVKTTATIEVVELLIGAIAGAIGGTLAGLGMMDLPGFHFLFEKGLVQGLITGAIAGSFVAGVIAIATAFVQDRIYAYRYDKDLNQGKYLVMVDGNKREIAVAHKVIHTQNLDLELE